MQVRGTWDLGSPVRVDELREDLDHVNQWLRHSSSIDTRVQVDVLAGDCQCRVNDSAESICQAGDILAQPV